MKLTTPKKKEDVLETIVTLWKDTEKEFNAYPNDTYYRGRYTTMLDLLKMIPIYEKE